MYLYILLMATIMSMNIGIIGQEEVCHCLLKINLICNDMHCEKYYKKRDLDPDFVAKYGGNVNIEYFLFVIVVVTFSV